MNLSPTSITGIWFYVSYMILYVLSISSGSSKGPVQGREPDSSVLRLHGECDRPVLMGGGHASAATAGHRISGHMGRGHHREPQK